MILRKLPIVPPRDLANLQNGWLPGELLEPTAGGDVMHHLAARAFNAMHAEAARDGVTLAMTDGYRPFETQKRLFLERYTTSPTLRERLANNVKVWNGAKWWKHTGVATAATPGRSNHGWGLAADITSVDQAGRFEWLVANQERFGFSFELDSERWHIHYVSGDDLPLAVLNHERRLAPAAQLRPITQRSREADDMQLTPNQRGDGRTVDFTWLPAEGSGYGFVVLSKLHVRRPVANAAPARVVVWFDGVADGPHDLPVDGRSIEIPVARPGLCSVEGDSGYPVADAHVATFHVA